MGLLTIRSDLVRSEHILCFPKIEDSTIPQAMTRSKSWY